MDNLPVHEEKSKGVYVKGLLEVFVGNVSEVFEVMDKGQANRVVASTSMLRYILHRPNLGSVDMNAESSRSHSIFVLHISQKNLNDGRFVRTCFQHALFLAPKSESFL